MKLRKFKITNHAVQTPLNDGRIAHVEESLDAILDYFLSGYKLPKGEKILKAEWFVDQSRNRVIYRLIIKNDKTK
jgi:hypothetical protein